MGRGESMEAFPLVLRRRSPSPLAAAERRRPVLTSLQRIMAGLSQDDFRRILATPRSVQSKDGFKAPAPKVGAPAAKIQIPVTPRGDASARPKSSGGPKKFHRPHLEKKKEEKEEAPGSKYRDRARERRDGVGNPDFEDSEDILNRLAQKWAVLGLFISLMSDSGA